MTEKIYNYFLGLLPTSPTKKRLYENFISLSALRGITYIFPLITLPYLVRVLGPEKYGLIAFAQAFAHYFSILTDYGFNLSATREISINRENKQKVSEIFSSVMVIKFLLLLVSTVIFSVIVFSFARFRSDYPVYLFSFILIIGNALFPIWFFQGMEKMKYITLISVVAKVFFLVCIFVFIRSREQYALVPLFSSLGYLISGLIAVILVFKDFRISFKAPSFQLMKTQFKNGWHFFTSALFSNLYISSNVFVLGLITSNELVGYFAGAEKIVSAFRGLLSPVSQTVYPYFSKLFSESKEASLKVLKRLGLLMGSFGFSASLVMFLFAPLITRIILGRQFESSVSVIRIMSFLPFIIAINNTFAVQGLFALGESRKVSKIIISSSLFHLPVFVLLTVFFSIQGAAMAIVLTEILVMSMSIATFRKQMLNKRF